MSASEFGVVERHFDAEELASLTAELIDIPTPMGDESPAAEYLHERLQRGGVQSRLQQVEDGRYNVVARIPGSGGGGHLLYTGHMDTTWGGDEDGIAPLGEGYQPRARRDGDWIYGMGAYNMKSGLASMLHAFEAVAKADVELAGDLIFAGVVGETSHAQAGRYQGRRYRGTGVGTRFLVTNGVTADMAVIAEPTNSRVNVDTGGYLLFEVTTKGNPGATYRRGGKGVEVEAPTDAIVNALRVHEAVRSWTPSYIESARYDGEVAVNVALTGIEGGHPFRPTKVASRCRMYYEVQLMPGMRQIDVEVGFRALLRGLVEEDPTLETDVSVIQNTPGSSIRPDEPVVQQLVAAHKHVHGDEPPLVWESWHADTTALTRYGIPTVCYGPAGRVRGGGSGYYPKEGEMCFLPDLLAGARVFAQMGLDVCNSARAQLQPRLPADRYTLVY